MERTRLRELSQIRITHLLLITLCGNGENSFKRIVTPTSSCCVFHFVPVEMERTRLRELSQV